MRQKIRFLKTVSIVLAACSVMMVIPSCIDSLYDLRNGLSTEMGLGGDSLAIPLGSTDTIRLGDFLDPGDVEMLKTMEDGGYGLSMKDSIEVDVPQIDPTSLKIDDKTFTQSQTVSFGDISLEDFIITGLSVNSDIILSLSSISLDNFAIPAISQQKDFSAGMSDYALQNPAITDIEVNGGKNNMFTGVTLPSGPGHVELPILDSNLASFSSDNDVTYDLEVPNGVTNIDDTVTLMKTPTPAVFEVSIELANAQEVLTGNIIPNIIINPSDLFIFSNSTPLTNGAIKFTSSDPLNAGNLFKKTKTYNIDAFNIPGEPSNGTLSITKVIHSSGSLSVSGAKVWSDKISQVADINLIVKVSVKNVVTESMEFNIPTLETNILGSTTFDINNSIPTEINKINKVFFNDPAKILIDLQSLNLPEMINKTITIDQLAITFPNEFVFEPVTGLSGQTYTINNVPFNPSVGKNIELTLKEMDMAGVALTGDKLVWDGLITYTGKVSFTGRINSKNIPAESNDTKMSINISSSMSFNSAEVTTNVIPKPLTTTRIPISLDVDIADQVKSLSTVNLTAGTKIRLNISQPVLPLNLIGDNIQITFPDLFIFKPDEEFPLLNNTLVINGEIPSSIELELASLNINQDLVDGKLSLNENIDISGGIQLLSGNVNSTEIDALTGKKLSIQASTPDLTIASTSVMLKTLASNFSDSTNLDMVINDLPAEIVSLDSIILADNATLILSVDVSNMPNLSKPLMANLTINFPDMLGFSPGSVDSQNRLAINKPFVDGKLSETVGIKSLHFDGQDLDGILSIHEKVKFNVVVSVEEPTVNSVDLNSNPISVAVQVKLNGIKFNSVYGKVNPGIDPILMEVPLSDLPEFMKGDDIVLDITKPIIALETQSNLGIPVNATMTLTPIKNESEISANKQTLSLYMPKAISSETPKNSYYWIAPDSAGMPQNYEFVQSDIQNLFKTIPDKIKLEVDAQADMQEQHYIDLNADYKMKVKYDVTVPMAFGKDLMINIPDTIKDLDEAIGKIAFSGHGLEIYGTFWNSIPLELEFQLIPVDKDDQPINVLPAVQIINAGAHDGSAVMTELSIKLNDPDGLLKEVRGFIMVFKASSNTTVAGTPIKPSNFVKADLKLRLNGGIKIGG